MKRTYNEMLLAEPEARDKLKARGLIMRDCEPCKGIGFIKKTNQEGEFMEICSACGGAGFNWEPPATKDL